MTSTINELIDKLKQTKLENFPKVLSNLRLDEEELNEYATWSNEGYTRNCLARCESFELLLLCWEEYQATPIHDHGGENCWVLQLNGTLKEKRYQKLANGSLKQTSSTVISSGELSYMDDSMGFHLLENSGDKRALTLHVYAKPIDQCEVFNNHTKHFEQVDLVYDTIIEPII